MPTTFPRRRFLATLAGATTFAIVPRRVLGGRGARPPSDRLVIAGVGLGARGADNLRNCEGETIGALCDVDQRLPAVVFRRHPKAKRYKDYRRLLEKEKGVEAVIVATPDHTHAVITAAAMKAGKHVYTQMPLAHDIWEVRQLVELARKSRVATQMGNERFSGPTIRTTVEWIQDGCIGAVREVHCWTNRPQWPQGLARPKSTPPVPARLDWDLWLGPAPARPYHPAYHPCNWRGWRDFGTGALGAVGCHEMDAAYWALRLAEAPTVEVEAEAVGATAESYPVASTIRYRFPARGDMPPLTLHWYDGGRRPPRPPEFPDTREFVGSNGTIFVGEKAGLAYGALVAGTHPGQAGPRFIPESFAYKRPKPRIPRVNLGGRYDGQGRHEQEWIRACKGGRPACARFEITGPLTEIVLLGNVAIAAGKPIVWDRRSARVTNEPEANNFIRRAYRRGWSL